MNLSILILLPALLLLAIAGATHATVVSGQVTQAGGSGIANVDLDFIDRDTNESLPLTNDDTDVLGFYAVSVPPGDYDIRFKPAAGVRFVPVELRNERVEGGSITINQQLQSGWFVSGRVLDQGLIPVTSLDIDVIDTIDDGPLYVTPDNTDQSGNFSFVVPTTNIDIEFEPTIGTGLVAKLMRGLWISTDTNIGDVTLVQGVHLSGLVHDSLGSPIEAVQVQTLDPLDGTEIFNIRNNTDPVGNYDLVVAPGNLDLLLIPPRGATVQPRFVAGIVDLNADRFLPTIVLDVGSLATGLVTAAGSPVESIDLDFESTLSGSEAFTPRDNTDADGLYAIAVPAGIYDIEFSPPSPTGLAPTRLSGVDLTTSAVLPTVQLQPAHTVSGVVQNGSAVGLVGLDLDFLAIPGGNEAPVSLDTTGISGMFASVIAAGTYDVRVNPIAGSGLGQTTIANVVVAGSVDLGTITLPAATNASPLSVTPNLGSTVGGTTVTVSGSNFAPGVKVSVGGQSLTEIVLLNSTAVTGVTPPHPVATVDLTVTNPGSTTMALHAGFSFTQVLEDPLLVVSRIGPLLTDIQLTWSNTGRPTYTIFRSTNPGIYSDAEVLDKRTDFSLRDDGAAAPNAPNLLFYEVQ
ncbi:MAG: IPT/TIG domain-containing protein [Acidobacteriota bacterium]|nr:IPT/TIG domain-containing protein [Acidobacteriota bacterium]MDH3784651.1 IPT/TIG domain-containing protein [Acidobacteriota bacterium]